MSVTLYCSISQFTGTAGAKGLYYNLGDQAGTTASTMALQVGAGRIREALVSAGYGVATIEDNPTTYPLLTQLNADLAAIRLLIGGGGSNIMDGKNETLNSLIKWTEQQIKDLRMGKLGFASTAAGVDDVTPPDRSRSIVVTNDRKTGVDNIDPIDWYEDDPIDQDRYGDLVENPDD